jgi:hypothetical protein
LVSLTFICMLKIDPLSTLAIRLYFKGRFYNNDRSIKYCGGKQAISYIDRDHVSLPEIVGHDQDHCDVGEGTLLHWLFLGRRDTMNGLRTKLTETMLASVSSVIWNIACLFQSCLTKFAPGSSTVIVYH